MEQDIPVYNNTTGQINECKWGLFKTECVRLSKEIPFDNLMLIPGGAFTQSK